MIRTILFDLGGTLDGDGLHWLDRFVGLYAEAGVRLPRETLRAAFDEAERRASSDEGMSRAHFSDMVLRHLEWQFEVLGLNDRPLRQSIGGRFIAAVERTGRLNVTTLSSLKDRGLTLGVVSNACGNADVLCDDLGYTPYLSFVVDSRRVGLTKPDPAIYEHAASLAGCPVRAIMMVGDSFERDIVPARSLGMKTAWLQPAGASTHCPDPALVDLFLSSVGELPARLETLEPTAA